MGRSQNEVDHECTQSGPEPDKVNWADGTGGTEK